MNEQEEDIGNVKKYLTWKLLFFVWHSLQDKISKEICGQNV